jgi:hypothetical protein
VAGPVGAAVGAVVGGVGGGLVGKAVGEQIDPTVEIDYWREAYPTRDYYAVDRPFETYEPAYRYGITHAARPGDHTFEDVESDLRRDWDDPYLNWDEAAPAVRDAYSRARSCPR